MPGYVFAAAAFDAHAMMMPDYDAYALAAERYALCRLRRRHAPLPMPRYAAATPLSLRRCFRQLLMLPLMMPRFSADAMLPPALIYSAYY